MDACPICWDALDGAQTTLACRHAYHTACWHEWLHTGAAPTCCFRCDAAAEDDEDHEGVQIAASCGFMLVYLAALATVVWVH
jgi:hypothetical protein